MSGELLRELAFAKATFQLRTLEMILRGPAIAIEAATAGETRSGSTEGKSAGPQDIAQTQAGA